MTEDRPQILLTNDDGIQSPGLWSAAEALSTLGFVHVAAPREQSSGTGRGLPNNSDGIIRALKLRVHEKDWTVYSVGGTPAQAVQLAILEILPRPPDLVVSGINYGENVGSGVTISGTVGAALEGSAFGIPALAISLETVIEHQLDLSAEIKFTTAAYFTTYFARLLLAKPMPFDVDVLKVEVPTDATPQTPWEVTRLARHSYYHPLKPNRDSWEEPTVVDYALSDLRPEDLACDSDVYTLRFKHLVSVTPLSLDLTSRVDLPDFERYLKEHQESRPEDTQTAQKS